MTTLLFVRHGETDWNAERRWQGHADVPLNERGRAQARALAEELAAAEPVAAVYTSDLGRARETAEIVAARLGLPVESDRELREIDVGSREGLVGDQSHRPWDGETHEAHAVRILGAVRRIADRHPSERVLVVTHGGCLGRLHEHLGIEGARFENCSVWLCACEDGSFRPLD